MFESLPGIFIFCFRLAGYYGFGVTPEQAIAEARAHGLRAFRRDLARGSMRRLPSGVVSACVDGSGQLMWRMHARLTPAARKCSRVMPFRLAPSGKWVVDDGRRKTELSL